MEASDEPPSKNPRLESNRMDWMMPPPSVNENSTIVNEKGCGDITGGVRYVTIYCDDRKPSRVHFEECISIGRDQDDDHVTMVSPPPKPPLGYDFDGLLARPSTSAHWGEMPDPSVITILATVFSLYRPPNSLGCHRKNLPDQSHCTLYFQIIWQRKLSLNVIEPPARKRSRSSRTRQFPQKVQSCPKLRNLRNLHCLRNQNFGSTRETKTTQYMVHSLMPTCSHGAL